MNPARGLHRYAFLILTLSLIVGSLAASAQPPAKIPIVGVLLVMSGPNDLVLPAIREGLRQRGYVDGTNIKIERRIAENRVERLPALAAELIALGADVIVVGGERPARAARQASSTIPIVMVSFDYDPVASGLVDSFNHPGGNITGLFARTSELLGKRLELLREALPRASRVAIFYDTHSVRQLAALEPARARSASSWSDSS